MVKLGRSWGFFLAGDATGNRAQDGVVVIPSAEVTKPGACSSGA
jgi:hypothetical protein